MIRPVWLCAGVVGLPLAASALTHLDNPYHFLSVIYGYRILPREVGPWVAALLPYFQLMIALFLFGGVSAWRAAFAWASLLFAAFTGILIATKIRGLNIDCGCFGSTSIADPIGPWTIARTAGLFLISMVGVYLSRRPIHET
jgi:putative oxidoreductase